MNFINKFESSITKESIIYSTIKNIEISIDPKKEKIEYLYFELKI